MDARSLATLAMVLLAAGQLEASLLALARSQRTQNNTNTASQDQDAPVGVQTSSGLLRGAKQSLSSGNSSVYKFLSVPYAEAPVGALRFQRPVELRGHESAELDASKFGKTCPQYRHLTRFISPLLNVDSEHQTSEDCLHLSLYVPASVGSLENGRLEPNKRLPVIVWIPGEGFDFADARQFDATHLAHKTQSIVVSVQYRVGVLGFLYEPERNIMGNMGLHDQIMALKWVRKNIGAFGGDSERVTLMGRFSGSMSISAIMTAPNQELIKWNGQLLFNRVALLSGIAVNDWIIDSQQAARTRQLEESALSEGLCSQAQVQNATCLQAMPVSKLLAISGYGWRLVPDNELVGQLAPVDAIENNQLAPELEAILVGETGTEGTLCLYRHMLESRNNNYAQLIEENRLSVEDLYEMIRYDSQTYFKYNLTKSNPIQSTLESLVEESSKLNLGEQEPSGSRLRDKYLNACSSYMVKSHSHRLKRNVIARNDQLVEMRANSNSRKPVEIHHYELRYKPSFSLAPDYIRTAAHGDDVPLIFGLIYNQPRREINDADLVMTRKIMAYIGNFVHGNNPLLCQHPSVSTKHESGAKLNENETTITSMDEDEPAGFSEVQSQTQSYTKRSWSSEGQVNLIDLSESELTEMNSPSVRSQTQPASPATSYTDNNSYASDAKEPRNYVRSNVRVILVDGPQFNSLVDSRAQAMSDLMELRGGQPEEQGHIWEQMTRSQRLQELSRQQKHSVDDNVWNQVSRRIGSNLALAHQQHQAQPAATMTLVNESSFMTLLMFISCIVIFGLMSLSLGLCLVLIRSNSDASKSIRHFTSSSSSSCNICEDSQGGSMDAVLNANRKDGREFSNVFAKLRHQPKSIATSHPCDSQCSSASNRRQTNSPVDLALHQRIETSAN